VTGASTLFAIHFMDKVPRNAAEAAQGDTAATRAFWGHMLENGIAYLSPTNCHAMLAEPHTRQDADEFLAAAEDFFRHYRK
jgi:glutamate-1-semialdehyde aminotransferase